MEGKRKQERHHAKINVKQKVPASLFCHVSLRIQPNQVKSLLNVNYKKATKLLWMTVANFSACNYLYYASSCGLGKGCKCAMYTYSLTGRTRKEERQDRTERKEVEKSK